MAMESLLYSEKTHAFELVGKQKFKRQSSAEKKKQNSQRLSYTWVTAAVSTTSGVCHHTGLQLAATARQLVH